MRPSWRLALGAAIAFAVAGGAWLALREDGASTSAGVVNDRRGAYGGVGMGYSSEDVRRVFGEPSSDDPGFAPAGKHPAEVGVPQTIPGRGTAASPVLKYEGVAFLLDTVGVYAFIVGQDGAETTRGVAIGDRMEDARRSYPALRCTDVAGGERLFGGQEFYPSCTTRLRRGLQIWFGRDPIKSITLVQTTR
jgi:hypothetical protein